MQSIKVKCDLAPILSIITRKPSCIESRWHMVEVKTNSLYHRPKQSSNNIRILQSSNLEKNIFNIPNDFSTANHTKYKLCTFYKQKSLTCCWLKQHLWFQHQVVSGPVSPVIPATHNQLLLSRSLENTKSRYHTAL